MNSQLEIRAEAARLAVMVDGIKVEDIIPLACEISTYILGDTDLPATNDPLAMYKDIIGKMKETTPQNSQDGLTAAIPKA